MASNLLERRIPPHRVWSESLPQPPHSAGLVPPRRSPPGHDLRSPNSMNALNERPVSPGPPNDLIHSSPLPQTKWADVPLPYRPLDYVETSQRHHLSPYSRGGQPVNPPQNASSGKLVPELPFEWRLKPRATSNPLTRAATSLRSKRKKKRDLLLVENDSNPSTDLNLLYPQMSPYSDTGTQPMSSLSAPEMINHTRSVSQPSTPNNFESSAPPNPANGLPRAPTYPPTTSNGRRRRGNSRGPADNAFADEAEFHLFAQATVGLGDSDRDESRPSSHERDRPSHSLDLNAQQVSAIPTYHGPGQQSHDTRNNDRDEDDFGRQAAALGIDVCPEMEHDSDSPVSPESGTISQHQSSFYPRSTSQRQRLETSPSGLDLWLHAPSPQSAISPMDSMQLPLHNSVRPNISHYSAPPTSSHMPQEHDIPTTGMGNMSLDPDDDAVRLGLPMNDDEDLPDYAQSQAEAQAGQRLAATRRAQELQMRWQMSSNNIYRGR